MTNTTSNGQIAGPSWLNEVVQRLPSYKGPITAADVAGETAPGFRLLHLNESPYPPSPKVLEAILSVTRMLNRYPDVYGKALASALAARTEVPAERIVFGCGSEELIRFLCQMTLAGGDQLVVPAPSFPMFALAGRLCGAMPIRVGLDNLGANDARALAASVTDRTRLVFCCTPNPPSGGMMTASAIEELVHAVPDTVLLVIDEAYHEFGAHAGGPSLIPIVARRRGPWVVLRTFSKAYGLAGLRLGYALCGSADVVEALRKVKLRYSATAMAQAAALAALEDESYLSQTLNRVAEERQRLANGIAAIGLSCWPSAANFVSAHYPGPARSAIAELRRCGILIRDWRDPEYPSELRMTVGLPEDTDAVLAAIGELVVSAQTQ